MSSRLSSFRSKRLKTKRRKTRYYKYGALAALLVFAFVGSIFVARAQFGRIQNVAVKGNELVQTDDLRELAWSELSGTFLWAFPKNSLALYPRKKIEEKIRGEFATISNIDISREDNRTLQIEVAEHEPDFLWCKNLERETCYFMDKNGYIFTESAGFSKDVLFTFYGLVDPENPVAKRYMPSDKFAELNSFIDSMKLLNISPIGLNARGQDDFELYLSSGGSILFSDREEFLNTFENLETIIAEQTRQDKQFLSKLEYIDIRFSSKVFVKLKNALATSESVETTEPLSE
jgi:cell division septal protein FtsQ